MRSMKDTKRGIYRKFEVERTDGTSASGEKHARCKYFVLDLMHDQFAKEALRAYAYACRGDFPHLSEDLMALVHGDRHPLRKMRHA